MTVHRLDINDPQRAHGFEHVLLMKGAPERILARSERIFVKGAEEHMTDEWKERFNSAYEELVRQLGTSYQYEYFLLLTTDTLYEHLVHQIKFEVTCYIVNQFFNTELCEQYGV